MVLRVWSCEKEEPRPVQAGVPEERQRMLISYIPGDPGARRSQKRSVGRSHALPTLYPDTVAIGRASPETQRVADMALAWWVAWRIMEGRFRGLA